MNKFKDIERVMIFLELVKGCDNQPCPSYKTLCNLDGTGVSFMNEDTLKEITKQINTQKENLESIGRVDIWAYGCGDTLIHPNFDTMVNLLKDIPFEKTVAVDSNCWKDNNGWGDIMTPVVLFKEGSFDIKELQPITEKWNKHFKDVRFGFILKTLSPELLDEIRKIQCNYEFVKVRSFHHVPLGMDLNCNDIYRYQRTEIKIDLKIQNVTRIPCEDKKAIRVMYRQDGSLRRCLISTTEKTSLNEFLMGDLSDCAICFPQMAGEQMLIFPDKIIVVEKARCVSDLTFDSIS